MASFSNLSKTYAKDKLSKCVTTVLLMWCYLYRKRSNAINVNAKAKEQDRDMQTPIDRWRCEESQPNKPEGDWPETEGTAQCC